MAPTCSQPRLKRSALDLRGAVAAVLALALPASAQSNALTNAGATVQAQLWYRDPLNTSNQTTSLSDALEFLVAP